ncbi:MAG TPA: hypothetical protein VF365_05010 [Candidatus Limnocylindria bacterium]
MLVQSGAGEASSNTDDAFREAGAKIVPAAVVSSGKNFGSRSAAMRTAL